MASQSVLELAVNTGKWDSGLKKAKTTLDNFTTASGGLQQALSKDADKMGTFVRMMGSMESRAKTAKGQMNDYKGTIEQLTMQYNRMTEAQQKTVGQDYLRTIEQLRQKYQAVNQEVQQMNRSLQQTPDVGNGGGLLAGLGGKLGGAMQVFAGNVMTKAAGAVVNFGMEIAGAVQQGVELAKQGEGIRMAFERLGRGDILQGLREATHGTVTDIELMKAAVKFNDFKLPLDELGTMLAFAQQKAKDTGQSVDYMVDSIVTGLGRKSLMILDNLGLSASDIKDKMKETGDMTKAVGEIIREQMSKAGDYVETAADRATKADVDLKNAMEDLGRTFAPLEEAGGSMFNSLKIKALDLLNSAVKPLIDALTKAGALRKAVNDKGGNDRIARDIKWLSYSDNKQQTYDRLLYGYFLEENKALADWRKAQGGGMGSIAYYKNQYDASKQLRQQFQNAAKPILNPQADVVVPDPDEGGGKGGKGGSAAKIRALKVEISESRTELQLLKDELKTVENSMAPYGKLTDEWKEMNAYAGELRIKIKEMNGEVGLKGISTLDMIKVPTAADMTKRAKQSLKNFKVPEKQEAKLTDIMSQMNGGISSMVSGIEGLGIELPKGMKDVLGGIQSVTSILTGIATVIQAIEVISTASAIIPFANGGVVKAAGGYRVPGRTFSGDMVPARLNAGELVLNQAQAGVIANALQDREFGGGSGTMQPYVECERVYLGMENMLKRKGKGEIVTTSMLRRLGLM